MLATRDDFKALHEPESNILCFAWTPRDVPTSRIDELTDALRERYNRSGRGFITVTTLDKRRVLRITVMNARTTDEHLGKLLDGLVAEGKAVQAHAGF